MAAGSKYAIKIVQEDSIWTADITRRVSRKEVIVSKTKSGFANEAEARQWAEAELKGFVENQSKRNKLRNDKR